MKIVIGQSEEHKPVGFDLDTLISTRLLIQANSGAGKSWLLRKMMEQLFGHIQVICIDPEGEFATLREKYGFVLVGKGGETPADPRIASDVAEKLLEIRASAICDIYELKPSEQHTWVRRFLDALIYAPKKLWHPLIVVVDEAHMFCPEKGAGDSLAKESMISLASKGRKRGFCPVWATQRLAKVGKDASSMMQNRLVGGTFEDVDIKRALDLLSIAPEDKREVAQQLKTLDPGWFFAFGRAISKERVLFRVGQVESSHPKPGSAKHASEPPPAPEQVRDLLPKLADLPKVAEGKARTVAELQHLVRSLKGELAAARRERPAMAAQPSAKETAAAIRSAVQEAGRSAAGERDLQWMRTMEKYRQGVERALKDAVLRLDGALHTVKFETPPAALKMKAGGIPVNVPPPEPAAAAVTIRVAPDSSVAAAGAPLPTRPYAGAGSNGNVSSSQKRILEALAQFEAIGHAAVPKKWLAALAQVSHTSGGYFNNLGALRSGGYIDYPQPGTVALTAPGRELVAYIEPPTDSAEMLERCASVVSGSQAVLLRILHAEYPRAIAKSDLAERAGVSATSGGFFNNLGALRSAGMIEYPEPGKACAADWLFLE